MRIIAGKFRSRQLRSLRGTSTRPTSDRLRGALFNVLTSGRPDALTDSVWIDLYAGTGAIGIEALSRGARMVYFVEASSAAASVVRANLQALGIRQGFEVVDREAVRALRRLDSQAIACDFCFLDPSYADHEAYEDVLSFLSVSRLIGPSAIVIAEHESRFDPGSQFGALQRFRLLEHGDAALSFYRLE